MPESDKDILAEIIREYKATPHRAKWALLAARLPLLGISASTFHRWKNKWGHRDYDRKARADKGNRENPERVLWTKQIMRLKYSKIKGVRALTTADAVSLAVQWGRVPPEALAVPEGTYNRLAREQGLTKAPRRGQRFEAPYFNYLHQVDASGSEYFYPDRIVNGEWIMKIRPRPQKNKPSHEGRRRLWYWGLADDYSGCRIARTVVAPGESALDGIEFLKFAWSNDPAHAPIHGAPFILYMDNGVLARHHAMQRFAEGALITIRTHEPDRAQATGKVETGWKDIWRRFEAQFLRLPDWQTREITLTELNSQLARFIRSTNQRKHRHLAGSKEQAWLDSARERGGLLAFDPGAWDHIFRDYRRTLDDYGCFDLHGRAYQVQEIHSCQVLVFKGVTTETMVVEDRRDGKRYYAQPYQAPVAGDFRASAHTPLEILLNDDPWKDQRPPLPEFSPGGNVVALPVRPAEIRQSGFVMPASAPPAPPQSLEELAAGVEIIQRSATGDEQLFADPFDRYKHLIGKEARGETLTPAEAEFKSWYEAEYASILQMLGNDLSRRARLAAVE
jgi:hypothetical protein